jgi:hypothetical protein
MEHGTVEMYRKHLRDDDEEPCGPCRAAQRAYISQYRRKKERDRTADTRAATIRRRALARLAQEYPERLAALIESERQQVGS